MYAETGAHRFAHYQVDTLVSSRLRSSKILVAAKDYLD